MRTLLAAGMSALFVCQTAHAADPPPPNPGETSSVPEEPEEPAESTAADGDHRHEGPLEVTVRALRPNLPAASRLRVGRTELSLRPASRSPANLLEAAPGLFVAQHAGGGKATQYFLRGFDADHGTDVAVFVDGVPINLVSHGHGQGYTDLNFMIPELVVGLDVYKGPYYAELGDFATAGAVNLRSAESLPESLASYSRGQFGLRRGVVAASPLFGERWRHVLAADVAEHDGPFDNPERYRRFKAFARSTYDFDTRSKVGVTLASYAGRWHGSGQLPARAVCGEGEPGAAPPYFYGQPCLDRFGSVDPSEGGQTQRHSAAMSYTLSAHDSTISALAYAVISRWNLYSNFTFFERDPVLGDGIEQSDDRVQTGADFRLQRHDHVEGLVLSSKLGLQLRSDSIENGLFDQRQRERLRDRNRSQIQESQIGFFAEADLRLTRYLRLLAGVRLQRVDVAVEDQREDLTSVDTKTSGTSGATLVLPKFSAIVTPIAGWELFGNAGRGFHSNDARGAVLETGRVDLLTPALGYELGTRVRPLREVSLQAAAFLLDLDSEQVWVGDEGTTEASQPSRRIGIELGGRARIAGWLFADLDATFTRAEFVDNAGNGSAVALAPTRTLTAGIGARPSFGAYTPFGSVRVKALADRPAIEDESLTAEGYTLLDLEAGLRWKFVEGALTVQNVLDMRWREVNFATESRLSYEPTPVTGIHYAPGWPRTVMGRLTVYWK